jgi:hypothetical protein
LRFDPDNYPIDIWMIKLCGTIEYRSSRIIDSESGEAAREYNYRYWGINILPYNIQTAE